MLELSSSDRIEKLETEVSELKLLVNNLLLENTKLRDENLYLKGRVKNLESKLSLNGAEYFCRIRSFISTAKKHGQNVLQQIFLAIENKDYVPQFLAI